MGRGGCWAVCNGVASREGRKYARYLFVDLEWELAGLGFALSAEFTKDLLVTVGYAVYALVEGFLEYSFIPAVDLRKGLARILGQEAPTYEITMIAVASCISIGKHERLLITVPHILEAPGIIVHFVEQGDEVNGVT